MVVCKEEIHYSIILNVVYKTIKKDEQFMC